MKTLLVNDGGGDAVLLQCLRARGDELTVSANAEEGKDRAVAEIFPLVVLDLRHLAQAQAFCRWFTKRPYGRASFLLVALPDGIANPALLLEAGASDLLPWPRTKSEIELRLAVAARQVSVRQQWHWTEQELLTRAQQQVAIAAMGQAALSEDLPTLSDLVSRFIVHTLNVEFCSLLEVEADGQTLRFQAGFGWREGWVGRTFKRPLPATLIGRTLSGEDLIIQDLTQDRSGEGLDFLREHGVVSGITVSVKAKSGNPFGLLGAFRGQQGGFVEDDLRFLQGLANVLGAAIERRQADLEIQKRQEQVQHLQRLESVGQMAASLAHDYNNVLTIIHGHLTLALGDPSLSPKSTSSLKRALEAAEKAAALTRQLLSFSRKQSMSPEQVELNSVVQGVARLLDRILGKSIRLETKLCLGLPHVLGDKGMLDQVLVNLAANARDAMPGGGTLSIETSLAKVDPRHAQSHPEAREGEFARLTVLDSGCGMDQSTLHRIFEPFFTTKSPGKGTGLGLSTVYGIVRQHQGWIEVESKLGHGTAFHLFLPFSPRAKPQPAALSQPAARDKEIGTILLVEDDPTLRELARLLLEGLGYRVFEAGSGSEALTVWGQEDQRIQLLLTDLVLPDGLTGFELAARLQQQRPNLRVMFASGYSPEKVRDGLPKGQPFHFLQKPYQTETLSRALQECFGVS